MAAVVREKGTDAWWLAETAELLPEDLRDRAHEYRRGDDTMVRLVACGATLSEYRLRKLPDRLFWSFMGSAGSEGRLTGWTLIP